MVNIANYEIHENFTHHRYGNTELVYEYDYDFSIITLHCELDLNYRLAPVCLPTKECETPSLFEEKEAWTTGWGIAMKNYSVVYPSKLQVATVKITSNSECIMKGPTNNPSWNITVSKICAISSVKAPCWRDSGSPLTVIDSSQKRHYLAGVVSYGDRLCARNTTKVYSRVTNVCGWIQDRM